METGKQINISKDFNASVEDLFGAWTQAEKLKQWWKTLQYELIDVEGELQEGGKIKYRFGDQGQDKLVIEGEYQEVVPNEKLVYTWNWRFLDGEVEPSDFKLNVKFEKTESGSKLDIQQDNLDNDEEAIKPHREGWDHALESLAQFLGGSSASRPEGTIDDHIKVVDYGGNQEGV